MGTKAIRKRAIVNAFCLLLWKLHDSTGRISFNVVTSLGRCQKPNATMSRSLGPVETGGGAGALMILDPKWLGPSSAGELCLWWMSGMESKCDNHQGLQAEVFLTGRFYIQSESLLVKSCFLLYCLEIAFFSIILYVKDSKDKCLCNKGLPCGCLHTPTWRESTYLPVINWVAGLWA